MSTTTTTNGSDSKSSNNKRSSLPQVFASNLANAVPPSPINLVTPDGNSAYHKESRSHLPDVRTWFSLVHLPYPYEHFISVDHFAIWRRHIAWAKHNGDTLRDHMTQRFASNMVLMSLLLSAEVGVLFSPSRPADDMRAHLADGRYDTFDFWAGLVIASSILLTLCSIVATFTAWAVVSVISPENSHCIVRSSLGLYACQLPSRLIVVAIYLFLTWVILFMFVLLPREWAIAVTIISLSLFAHVMSVYSALGRLILYTKAMSNERIFKPEEEESMAPFELLAALMVKAKKHKVEGVDVMTHYRKEREASRQNSRYSRQNSQGTSVAFESCDRLPPLDDIEEGFVTPNNRRPHRRCNSPDSGTGTENC